MSPIFHSDVARIAFARRLVHWLSALLVFALLASGFWITQGRPASAAALADAVWRFSAHKTIGVAVGLLTLWRLWLMWRCPFEAAGGHRVEAGRAGAVQGFMLAALVGMPASGLAQHLLVDGVAPVWFFPVELFGRPKSDPQWAVLFGRMHRALGWGLMVALALHAGGALKHHFWDRSGVLLRMIGGHTRPGLAVVVALDSVARRWRRAGLVIGIASAAALAILQGVVMGAGAPSGADSRAAAKAGEWRMDPRSSVLEISAVQGGTAFSARFARFGAVIVFDPARLDQAKIEVSIEAASFTSGLPDRDSAVAGADWLDAAKHPAVRWVSSRVEALGGERYRAQGTLAIAGASAPVALEFALKFEGRKARAQGTAQFARSALKLGRGETGGPDFAGDGIGVTFVIEAERR